jgi:hypothetical protein
MSVRSYPLPIYRRYKSGTVDDSTRENRIAEQTEEKTPHYTPPAGLKDVSSFLKKQRSANSLTCRPDCVAFSVGFACGVAVVVMTWLPVLVGHW